MAQQQRTQILFPVGRLVMGSLYKPRTQDAEGKPLTTKNGPDAGKPRVDYFAAVAIPKAGEPHWSQTAWGQEILKAGAAAFPQAYQAPTFAWKIDDGDSQVPNRKGRKPCDNEGWKGCWVLKFGGGYAPKVYQQPSAGTFVELTTPEAVKLGYHVQVSGNVSGNGSAQQPGVYLNHNMVLFIRPDAEIVVGPDAASAFAGAAVSQALPGATAMPFAAPQAPVAAVPPAAPALAPPPLAVAPNPAFLGAAPAPAVPAALAPPPLPMAAVVPALPVAPAVPAEPQMTPAGIATGHTYQQYRAAGYTDEVLRQHGLIV